MLAHELAGSPRDRGRETFHLSLLEHLAPQLLDVPLQGGEPWAARHGEAARRARRGLALAAKASREARRRAGPRLRSFAGRLRGAGEGRCADAGDPAGTSGTGIPLQDPRPRHDPFVAMRDDLRDLALSDRGHPAWEVLDGERVKALLSRDPGTLDEMSRLYVWRLATVFAAPA